MNLILIQCVLYADAFVDAGPSDGLVRSPLHGSTRSVTTNRTGLLLRALLPHYQILQLQGVWHFKVIHIEKNVIVCLCLFPLLFKSFHCASWCFTDLKVLLSSDDSSGGPAGKV